MPVVLHGHFYQPPREDPRTGLVPAQPSAAPYHDWNERISAECYEPLAGLGAFAWMSFDAGPTLMRWLERERPLVHEAIVAGDRESRERLGHGNAIAQPFHHVILPLATPRERTLEIRWGLADFERRFGRPSEGMWLPETAVDRPTLEALAEAGVAFTVLAPHQVAEPPAAGVGRVALAGGREIAVFVYDGELSHGVAFGGLLGDADRWIAALEARAGEEGRAVSLAVDGETFGHHHRGAERTLAEVIARLRSGGRPTTGGHRGHGRALHLTNFAARLASAGELEPVELVEETSWSCAHGIERWRAECGCRMAPERDWRQSWRAPLRAALRELAGALEAVWQAEAPARLSDPEAAVRELWRALAAGPAERDLALGAIAGASDGPEARALLGMAADAAAMFTSCAWFFDEVARLEPVQALRYAAHALDELAALRPEQAADLERRLVAELARAPSNEPEVGDAARLWTEEIRGPGGLLERLEAAGTA